MQRSSIIRLGLAGGFVISLLQTGCRNGPTAWSSRGTPRQAISKRDLVAGEGRVRLRGEHRNRTASARPSGDEHDITIQPQRKSETIPRRDDAISMARHTTPDSPRSQSTTGRRNPFDFIKRKDDSDRRDPFLEAQGIDSDAADSGKRVARRTRRFPETPDTRQTGDNVPSLDDDPNQFVRGFDNNLSRLRRPSGRKRTPSRGTADERTKASPPGFPQVAETKTKTKEPKRPRVRLIPDEEAVKRGGRNPFEEFVGKTAANSVPDMRPNKPGASNKVRSTRSNTSEVKTASATRKPARKQAVRPTVHSDSNSTAQLPDPTRSPGVANLSEGDPSLVVDSHAIPAEESGQSGSLSTSDSLDFPPTSSNSEPPAVPKPQREQSKQPEIQIVPRNPGKRVGAADEKSSSQPESTAERTENDIVQASATNTAGTDPFLTTAIQKKPAKLEWKSLSQKKPAEKPATAEKPAASPPAPREFPPQAERNAVAAKRKVAPQPPETSAEVTAHTPGNPNLTGVLDETPGGTGSSNAWLWIAGVLLIVAIAAALWKRRAVDAV